MPESRILVVDDHAAMRGALEDMLRHAFPAHEVVGAAGVQQALKAVAAACPALAIIDFALEDGNGIDLAARLRERCRSLRVIVLSQHAAKAYADHALASGAFAFIAKERLLEDFVPAVRSALDSRDGDGA